jgi:hypothetical protein
MDLAFHWTVLQTISASNHRRVLSTRLVSLQSNGQNAGPSKGLVYPCQVFWWSRIAAIKVISSITLIYLPPFRHPQVGRAKPSLNLNLQSRSQFRTHPDRSDRANSITSSSVSLLSHCSARDVPSKLTQR